jgi:hypothetical protein
LEIEMSRTYRALSGDQYWAKPWGCDCGPGCRWNRCDKTVAKHFHSDCHWRDSTLGQFLKHVSGRKRRSDERKETFRVVRVDEAEYIDREGIYRGLARWYA